MLAEDWEAPENRCVGLLLAGEAAEPMPAGSRAHRHDETLLLLLNAQSQAVAFVLPALQEPGVWEVLLWTDDPRLPAPSPLSDSQEICLPAQALALLRYRPSMSAAVTSGTGAGALVYAEGGERS